MHVAVGHGESADSNDAARAALEQALNRLGGAEARAVLVFTGVGVDPREVLELVATRLPDVPLVGGTSAAELSRELGPVECSVLIVLFAGEGLEVGAGIGPATDAARAVEQAASGMRSPAKLCICAPKRHTGVAMHPPKRVRDGGERGRGDRAARNRARRR